MHAEAFEGARKMIAAAGVNPANEWQALDLGGADYNGTARTLLPYASWTGLDLNAGPGVDIVADATTWQPDRMFDVVMCTELLEHVQQWRACLKTARAALRDGGTLIVTCASDGRPRHGARGAALPEPEEWYDNVYPNELRDALCGLFSAGEVTFNPNPGDVYAWARA